MYQLKKLTSTKKPESRDIRDLKIQRRDSNENVKKKKQTIGLMSKTTTLHMQHTFL